APVVKRGKRIELAGLASWEADGPLGALPDGPYTFALRPHHVQPAAPGDGGAVVVQGRVSIAELSGSESVIHFGVDGDTWVSQSRGVRRLAVGEALGFRLEVGRGLYFAGDGRCVAAGGV
ncbi:MAG: TOBE domain-containing protein, partial [Anaeromyxobacteraceae bacterium]|nr:TOBE domain-containing protein [Anaeromyxobacteraceae bacterium]